MLPGTQKNLSYFCLCAAIAPDKTPPLYYCNPLKNAGKNLYHKKKRIILAAVKDAKYLKIYI
jgi:hypothetical protein